MKRAAEEELEKSNGTTKKPMLQKDDPSSQFVPGLFDEQSLDQFKKEYDASLPYNHGVIPSLLDTTLLRTVRSEIKTSLPFTVKETDIYKIHQSFDLASISALSTLPALLTLRTALYSSRFRTFLSKLTSCGPLSGSKTDMAVNLYTNGCHLLCHDDVIGTRRLSYILYLTDPEKPWQPEWGGALRLFGTEIRKRGDGQEVRIALPEIAKSIPPAFGQLAFFEVRPGESFHDVEEVHAGEGGDERVRTAISGWFHEPQIGEEGYDEKLEEKKKKEMSSLEQLSGGKSDEFDKPAPNIVTYPESEQDEPEDKENINADDSAMPLTASELDFLLQFLSPSYLTPDAVEELSAMFESESALALSSILAPAFANRLHTSLTELEAHPPSKDWELATPPHKHNFHFLQPSSETASTTPLESLLSTLLPSTPFRKYLSLITGLTLTTHDLIARRFRRGESYALAMGSTAETQLEVRFGVSPAFASLDAEGKSAGNEGDVKTDGNGAPRAAGDRRAEKTEEVEAEDEVDAEEASTEHSSPTSSSTASQEDTDEQFLLHGGYESYLAPSTSEGDAAVYQRSTTQKPSQAGEAAAEPESDDEDGATLFQTAAGWDRLSIVLRDRGVLRFVKFLESGARGDRWDVGGVWGVGDEDDDDGGEEGEDGEGEEGL